MRELETKEMKRREHHKEYMKKWVLKNPEKHKGYGRNYYKNNRENRLEYQRKYKLKYPEKVRESRKKWRINNHRKVIEYNKKYAFIRSKIDLNFKLSKYIKHRIWYAFKKYSTTGKIYKTSKYGIDFNGICKKLIETLPEDYNNKPSGYYHRDEIIPCSHFNFDNPEDIKKCFSPENVQWLSAKDNLRKNAKTNWRFL